MEETVFGETEPLTEIHQLAIPHETGQARVAALSNRYLYVGTEGGQILAYDLSEAGERSAPHPVLAAPDPVPWTAMAVLLGRTSLVAGDAQGQLRVIFPVSQNGTAQPTVIRRFQGHSGSITRIIPDHHTRAFLTLTATGEIGWHHMVCIQFSGPSPGCLLEKSVQKDLV